MESSCEIRYSESIDQGSMADRIQILENFEGYHLAQVGRQISEIASLLWLNLSIQS